MEVDYRALDFGWKVGSALVAVALFVYTWISTRDKDNSKHIKAVEEMLINKIAEHDKRMTQLETAISHLPTAEKMAELRAEVRVTGAQIDGMSQRMGGVTIQLSRIEDYLLKERP